jgi:hypothetical protein
MKLSNPGSIVAIAAMALLSACGGDVNYPPYDSATRTAALMVQGAAPVADCEAEGCNRPRIIDGLAEQYRNDAIVRAAQPSEPVQDGMAQAPAVAEAAPMAPSEPPPAAPAQAL